MIAGAEGGDERCRLALDVYIHRLATGVAAMAAAMNGLDGLVFTGGAGEHEPRLRAAACEALAFLGIALDPEANAAAAGDRLISAPGAGAATLVVSAREDIEIARQARATLSPA